MHLIVYLSLGALYTDTMGMLCVVVLNKDRLTRRAAGPEAALPEAVHFPTELEHLS